MSAFDDEVLRPALRALARAKLAVGDQLRARAGETGSEAVRGEAVHSAMLDETLRQLLHDLGACGALVLRRSTR